jgi:hypothetical protein
LALQKAVRDRQILERLKELRKKSHMDEIRALETKRTDFAASTMFPEVDPMNNAMRYSIISGFHKLSHLLLYWGWNFSSGAGPDPSPTYPMKLDRLNPGTDLATKFGVREDLFRPLGAVPDPNEAMWRSMKGEQSEDQGFGGESDGHLASGGGRVARE